MIALVLSGVTVGTIIGVCNFHDVSSNNVQKLISDYENTTIKRIQMPAAIATVIRQQEDPNVTYLPEAPLLPPPTFNPEQPGDLPPFDPNGYSNTIIGAAEYVMHEYVQYHTRYIYGGKDPHAGIDCMATVHYIYKTAGLDYGYLDSRSMCARAATNSLPGCTARRVNGTINEVRAIAQPGDIIVWAGHGYIWAGNDLCYNWGGHNDEARIANGQSTRQAYVAGNPAYVLHHN